MRAILISVFMLVPTYATAADQAKDESGRDVSSLRLDKMENREEPKDTSLSVTGLVQMQISSTENYNKDTSDDIVNSIAEIDIEKKVREDLYGRITLLHIDDQSPDTKEIFVDEAILTFGNPDNGFYFTGGKMYVPYGQYDSDFASYPLTYDMGLTNENAALIGFKMDKVSLELYNFNGDVDESGEANRNRNGGATLAFKDERDDWSGKASIGYINSFGDTDLLATIATKPSQNLVAAAAVGIDFSNKYFFIRGEWLGATEKFLATELKFRGRGAKPQAFKSEIGYKFPVAEKVGKVVLGYQGTEEALALEMPRKRGLAAVGLEITKGASIMYEFKREEDYRTSDCAGTICGTSKSANTHTLQLGLEF